MGIDRELLAQREFDDGLLLSASEEGHEVRRIAIAKVAAAHIARAFCSSRRYNARLNLARRCDYPSGTSDGSEEENESRIKSDGF